MICKSSYGRIPSHSSDKLDQFILADGELMLIDIHGHQISYLRISVTDRCNLRCVYCMPSEGVIKQSHQNILRYEEIAELVRVFAGFGVHSVRLTGGEPLVRPELYKLVEMIANIPGIEDISMTTNALLLEREAKSLADAGLNRVNISLDTMDPDKFVRISRYGSLERIWLGIEAAEKYHLNPIKINVVALRGINDDEFVDLALLTKDRSWSVRFIELMPVGNQIHWGDNFPSPADAYISAADIRDMLKPLELVPIEKGIGSGPARVYQIPGAKGTIGFISPLSDHFCGDCNRLRITADGNLRPCLLSDIEIPLLPTIRSGESILPLLERSMALKPAKHDLDFQHLPKKRRMKEIGG